MKIYVLKALSLWAEYGDEDFIVDIFSSYEKASVAKDKKKKEDEYLGCSFDIEEWEVK